MFAKKVTLRKELKKMRTSHADIWVENLSGQLAQRVRRPWDRSKPRVFEEQQGDRCSRSGMKGGRSEGMTGDRGGIHTGKQNRRRPFPDSNQLGNHQIKH